MQEQTKPDPDAIEIDAQDLLKKIAKHKLLITACVLLSGAGALAYSYKITPIYRATSRILVDSGPPKITKVENVVLPDYTDRTNFFNSQIEILKSHTLAEMVIKDLGGYEPIKRRGKSSTVLRQLRPNEVEEALLKQVKVVPVRLTQIITVNVEDSDPELAARIADSWTRAYVYFASVDQLVQRRSELQADLVKQLEVYKKKHPVILGLQNQIAAIEAKIKLEEERLDRQRNSPLNAINTDGDITNIKILDRAEVPIKPVKPQKSVYVLIALLLGLFVGLGAVFLIESFDLTIRTIPEIEQLLYYSCLGAIPYHINRERHKVKPAEISAKVLYSGISESFRSLRTNILFSNPDYPKRTFVITSSSPFEGKSTVASNLGTVFAQANERTILVDTDMRRPTQHTNFRVPRDRGISDALASEKDEDLRDFIRKTDVPGLDLMTCGSIPPNPSELLGSRKMERVIAQLLTMYDRVIFDTPPVLAATDAVVLSTKVDSTILVVRSGFTHRQAALRSRQALKSVQARVLGVVLNMLRLDAHGPDSYNYFYETEVIKKKARKQVSDVVKSSFDFFLLGALVAAPLAYGAVHPGTQRVFAYVAPALFFLAFCWRPWALRAVLASPFTWLGGGMLAYAALQLVPLPLHLIRVLSPGAYNAYVTNITTQINLQSLFPLSLAPAETLSGIIQFMTYGFIFAATRMRLMRGNQEEVLVHKMSLQKSQYLKLGCLAGVGAIVIHSLYDFNLHIPANGMFFVFLLALGTGAVEQKYDHAFFRLAVRTVIIFGFLTALFSIVQKVYANGRIYWVGMPGPEAVGPYYNYDHFAGLMEMCGAVAVGMVIAVCFQNPSLRNKKAVAQLIMYLIMACVIVTTIVTSTSRGGIMSFALAQVIFFFLVFKAAGRRNALVSTALPVLTGIALTGILVVWLAPESLLKRCNLMFIQNLLGMEGPINPRLLFYHDAWRVVGDFPLTGTGLNTFAAAFAQYRTFDYTPHFLRYTHNDYLQLLSETGVAGAAFCLAFIGLFLYYMRRLEKNLK